MAAPSSMRLSVLGVEAAAKNIQSGKYGKQRLFLLFKNPKDVLRFIEAQGPIKTVNVGNMSYKEGAREVTKSIQVLPEEEQIFETIASKGVTVTAQLVPNDPVVDFMKNYAAKTVRLRKNILNLGGNFNAFSSVSNYFNYYLCVYCY